MPYPHKGKKNFNKRSNFKSGDKNETYVQQEKISEAEVGISEYITNSLEGFTGIIKARYSDFHVNEIDLDGNIVKLTDTKPPKLSLEEDSQDKDEAILEELSPGICEKIVSVLSNESNEPIEIDISELSKENRTNLHKNIKLIYSSKITAETISKDEKKYIKLEKYDNKNKSANRQSWPKNIGDYVHFLVYKECLDTMEACLRISSVLHIKPSNLNYAGVKDRRAKTTQWFSVKKALPQKISDKTKQIRNIKVGNFVFKDEPLKLGQLKGNRFRIALRNVSANDKLINAAMTSLKENGFINYYGLQRFGCDKEVPTYAIGIKLLQGQWKEACQLILKPRQSDYPHSDVTKAKKAYAETSNPETAIKQFSQSRNNCIEFKLLQGLAKNNSNDYVNALENIPRNSRLLYIHSFQSLIWNKVVSKRIKQFGLKPIEGDLVVISEDFIEDNVDICDGNEEIEEKTSSEMDVGDNLNSRVKVKTLKKDELDKYSIYDVVLPLPGYDIEYPENDIKNYYEELLKSYDLSLEMPKQKVKTYNLSGTYRKILKCVYNLSWKVLRYDDPNDVLIRSDYEELLGKDEPQDKPDGKYKGLVTDFCLDSCCYATMVLREVLKMDTNTVAHAKLNNYYKDADDVKEKETNEQESHSNFIEEDDLLSNKEKFDEFKKFVFGGTNNSEDVNDVPTKRAKHE